MTLALSTDHHVNFAIVERVRPKGIDVLTTLEDGSDRRSDEEIPTRANELGRVIFTQDVDFIVPADEWLGAGRPFAGIVFAHQLGVTIGRRFVTWRSCAAF